tara:strand:- start:760 stop:1599 length:840 start_codon:yes stop_codon:yes gene_type:complete
MEEMTTEATPDESGQVASGSGVGTPESSHFDRMQFDPTSLPEGLRNEPSLQTFTSVDNLAKSYVNAVKKIGGNPDHLVQLPQEGESRDNFYNKIGRPETPEGYDFGEDDGRLDFYRNATHQLGLTQDQAANMLKLYASVEEEQSKAADKQNADFAVNSQINLKREWGTNYDSNIDMAQRAFAQFASPEFSKLMDETGLGNHPELLKAFSKVGQMLGDDQLVVGSGIGGQAQSPQMAKEEIESLYQDKEFSKSYLDKTDVNHKAASTKMDKLFRTAYPGR